MAFCRLITVLVLVHITGGLYEFEMGFIFRGQDAPKDRWPWMVHLNITSDGIKKWRCGGTILNNQWVLTAAHCWDKSLNPNYRRSMAWIGVHSLQKGAVSYCGIKFEPISHPAYRAVGDGYVNDLALVKLGKKLTFSQSVRPVSLPSVDDTFGPESECWITGWGNTGTGVPLPDPETLQELKVPIVPNIVCETQHPELTSDMLCAGDMTRRKDLCTGDYGGPLVCRRGSGFVQVGIMSYGSPSGCVAGRPGIFTKVSKYLRYINDYINQSIYLMSSVPL